jgi:hypothetical protein
MSEDEEILKELLRENEGPRVIAAFMIEKDFSITVLITNAELKKSCTAQKRNEIAMEMKAIILPHHPTTTIIHNTYNFYGSIPKEKNVAEIETKKPTPLLSSTKQLVVEEKPESKSKSNYALDDNDDDYYQ